MSCSFWSLWYYNPYYGIYQGEQDMIHQGYAFLVGDRFEALSCSLAVNSIGRRPERLQLISNECDLEVIGNLLNVVIRVIDIKADTIMFSNFPCFSTLFPIERKGWKKEIYIGRCDDKYYAICMTTNADRANLCASLFYIHGRYIHRLFED